MTRVTSGSPPTEKARDDEIPSRDNTRASCTPWGASAAMVTTNVLASGFPASETFGFAVILGSEKSSSFAPSMFSPVIVTSKLVPALPAHRHHREQARRGEANLLGERRGAEPESHHAGDETGECCFVA